MKYDERACKFNMDTGCVELLLRDGRKISIDCTGYNENVRYFPDFASRLYLMDCNL